MNTSFQGTSKKGTVTWITPKIYIDALGPFDLDPCAHTTMPWRTANTMLTVNEDGLKTSWKPFGRTWMNPPYLTSEMPMWLKLFAQHRNGISLTFASTDVDWFDWIWLADAILFKKGRIPFCNELGKLPLNEKGQKSGPGKGSVFAAFGAENVDKLERANYQKIIPGKIFYQNQFTKKHLYDLGQNTLY